MKESHRVELKLTLTDSLEKEVVAFLNNREGGVIYIGINDNGIPQGVENIDAVQLQIKDRLKNNIHPISMGLFDIISEEIENKEVIKIIVASGPEKPYYLKKQGMSEKGCFIRLGTAAEPMPNRMIENLFARRTRNSIGKIRSNQQILKFEQLKIYYYESGKQLNTKFATNLGLLTEDGVFNYVAFLMSDINSISIKVAKYKGKTRVQLVENNEYGYCSIIKATKQVLDKIELENKTKSRITSKERIDTPLWNAIAIREAIINAIVHNDYSHEVPPKFEIFDDRIEITSAGSLPDMLSQEEFFEGFSMPRNQEMMRIFKDLKMVEHLGSGIPRILEAYSQQCFKFTENFLRMTFPNAWDLSEDISDNINEIETPVEDFEAPVSTSEAPVKTPVEDFEAPVSISEAPVKALVEDFEAPVSISEASVKTPVEDFETPTINLSNKLGNTELAIIHALLHENKGSKDLLNALGYGEKTGNFKKAIFSLLSKNIIEYTIPHKPNSRLQKYRLSEIGKAIQSTRQKER